MNYTKGAWIVVKQTYGSIEIKSEHNSFIAGLPLTVPSLTECEANAQLISAAPDLYEACKEMMERFNRGTRFPLQSTSDKMNQAIAKADGKT